MKFIFDSSTSILFKKAEETGDTTKTETTSDPTDDVVDQKEYVEKAEAAEKLKKQKSLPNKLFKKVDEITEKSKDFTDDAENLVEKEAYVKRWMLSRGYNVNDFINIENSGLPLDTQWKIAKQAMDACIKTGYEDFKKVFDLVQASYLNQRNKVITDKLLELAIELQSKYLDAPIFSILQLGVEGNANNELAEVSRAFFRGDDEDSAKFDHALVLAQFQYTDDKEKVLNVLRSSEEEAERAGQDLYLAQSLYNMMQEAPFNKELANVERKFLEMFKGAAGNAAFRAWHDVFRSLLLGQKLKEQLSTGVFNTKPQTKIINTAESKNKLRLSQNQEAQKNPIEDLVKEWPKLYSQTSRSAAPPVLKDSVSKINEIINVLINNPNLDPSKENDKAQLDNLQKNIESVTKGLSSSFPDLKLTNAQNISNKFIKTAQEGVGWLGGGAIAFGSVAAAVVAGLDAFANSNWAALARSIFAVITFIAGLIRNMSGSAALPGLTAAEQSSVDALYAQTGINSTTRNEIKTLKQRLEDTKKTVSENENLINSTVETMVDIGKGQTKGATSGTPEQAYLRYKKWKEILEASIKDADRLIKIESPLQTKILSSPSIQGIAVTEGMRASVLKTKNYYLALREEFLAYYKKIAGVSIIAQEIQKNSLILQQMESLDTMAEGVSQGGPGALSGAMLGKNGIYSRVNEFIQNLEDAKTKLMNRQRVLLNQISAGNINDPNMQSKQEAEVASIERNLNETQKRIEQVKNWQASVSPYGEYKSFTSALASKSPNFKVVKADNKTAGQENIDEMGNYLNKLFDNSLDKPQYGDALKNPEKWRVVPTTEIK